MSKIRIPRQPRREVWVVRVDRPYNGSTLQDHDLRDLADELGYGSDEYWEAAGPAEGAVATSVYGPYTERQAKKVAAGINALSEDADPVEAVSAPSAQAQRLWRYIAAPDAPARGGEEKTS